MRRVLQLIFFHLEKVSKLYFKSENGVHFMFALTYTQGLFALAPPLLSPADRISLPFRSPSQL